MKEENAVCNKCNRQVNISLVEIQGLSDKWLGKENLFTSTKRSDSPSHSASDAGIKLVESAWLWYSFPEVRNRKETESGLVSTLNSLQANFISTFSLPDRASRKKILFWDYLFESPVYLWDNYAQNTAVLVGSPLNSVSISKWNWTCKWVNYTITREKI